MGNPSDLYLSPLKVVLKGHSDTSNILFKRATEQRTLYGEHIWHIPRGYLWETPLFLSPDRYKYQQIGKQWEKPSIENSLFLPESDTGSSPYPAPRPPQKLTERLFGQGGLRWRGHGTIGIATGIKRTVIDNPTLSANNRSHTSFRFAESIQLQSSASVGEKLSLNINYDSDAIFNFDSKQLKLNYKGYEHEKIKHIEVGNVRPHSSNSLINGGNALMGIKAELQFGKLKANTIVAQQRSQKRRVLAQGGQQTHTFQIAMHAYEANQHFFLSNYFKDTFEDALRSRPYVNSRIYINRVEVWVTNRKGDYQQARNVVAFTDLGESSSIHNPLWRLKIPNSTPQNGANDVYENLNGAYRQIRDINRIGPTLSPSLSIGTDYEKIESARLLSPSEYIINHKLGYISLITKLHDDDILAIAYEYTIDGQTYQVGEFSTDIPPDGTNTEALFLKLLKPTSLTPQSPLWHCMMKNVYSLGATDIQTEGINIQMVYRNDSEGIAVPYFPEKELQNKLLLQWMGLDNLDGNNNAHPDGNFDFIPGYTILPEIGRIIFPSTEPLGSSLNKNTDIAPFANKYAFTELYDSTQTVAQQYTDKNKFYIQGYTQGGKAGTISLGAQVVPGSVTVQTGSNTLLQEGVDYMVDYANGQVVITNSRINSSTESIIIDFEEENNVKQGRKTLLGLDLHYSVNKYLSAGATVMNLSEKNYSSKINYGNETVNNLLLGLHVNYNSQSDILTNFIKKVPLLQMSEAARISFTAETAHLIAHNSRNNNYSYLDDFENSRSSISLINPHSWKLASTPQDQSAEALFPEATLINNVDYGKNRALLSWFSIAPLFTHPTTNRTPTHLFNDKEQLSNHFVRKINEQEIFPHRRLTNTEVASIPGLNLSFYPTERGPYNIDADNINTSGELLFPSSRWGGIMQAIETTDFEKANIGFIRFWLLDPFIYHTSTSSQPPIGGDLYFNLGSISEDILKDGRKSFENGLPTGNNARQVDFTVWGKVPKAQSTITAFDDSRGALSRQQQDVGLDGLSTEEEHSFSTYADYVAAYKQKLSSEALSKLKNDPFSPLNDPAGDNYHSYLGADFDQEQRSILNRYKYYNGTEGNSSGNGDRYNIAASNSPDSEDINGDNTLNEQEAYYQYKVELRPEKMHVGQNFIVDTRTAYVELPNGKTEQVTWYQFQIPLQNYQKAVGNIQNFNSIRFIRLFLTNFHQTTHLRFATLELMQNQWRIYQNGTTTKQNKIQLDAVNIEENTTRTPVNYVLPPNIERQRGNTPTQTVEENEQALALNIEQLPPQEEVSIYKEMSIDLRQYEQLELFSHLHHIANTQHQDIANGELSLFIRMGNDHNNNFYEYEIPLEPTPHGSYNNNSLQDRLAVWRPHNTLKIPLKELTQAKNSRNNLYPNQLPNETYHLQATGNHTHRIGIKGNPSLADIQLIMIGVRNKSTSNISAEIWVNELRLLNAANNNGWAARGALNISLADLATIDISAHKETEGFGALDQTILQQRQDNLKHYNIDLKIDLGKVLPPSWKLSAPVNYYLSQKTSTPKYSFQHSDLTINEILENIHHPEAQDSIRQLNQTVNTTKGVSINNLRFQIQSKTPMPYDPANFSLSYSNHQTSTRSPIIQYNTLQQTQLSILYSYSPHTKSWTPFKNSKLPVKNLRINYIPQNITISSRIQRRYEDSQLRHLQPLPGGNSSPRLVSWKEDFHWNRQITTRWDLSPNMKIDFQSETKTRIETPYLQANKKENPEDYHQWKKAAIKSILHGGTPIYHRQQTHAHYNIPFSYVPMLNWITTSINYLGSYSWSHGGSLAKHSENIGNTISNSRSFSVNGQMDFLRLFNKSESLKQINQHFNSSGRNRSLQQLQRTRQAQSRSFKQEIALQPDSGIVIRHHLNTTKIDVSSTEGDRTIPFRIQIIDKNTIRVTSKDSGKISLSITPKISTLLQQNTTAKHYIARGFMSLKNISINYTSETGSTITGFAPQIGQILGQASDTHTAPGWGYALGMKTNEHFYNTLQNNNWLVPHAENLAPALFTKSEQLHIRTQIEPIKGLNIDLETQRITTRNTQVSPAQQTTLKQFSGSYSITTIALRTSLRSIGADNNYSSKTFDTFLQNRAAIAARYDVLYSNAGKGKPISLMTPNSPDVLIPAFLSAYLGKSTREISLSPFPSLQSMLPNWRISYDGLIHILPLREKLKSIRISHSYAARYQVGAYTSYAGWTQLSAEQGYIQSIITGSLVPSSPYDISSVSITENFSPLIGIDVTTQDNLTLSFKYNNTRNITLSTSSFQLVEFLNKEWNITIAHKIPNINKILRIASPSKNLKQQGVDELSFRFDFSHRTNYTLLRNIEHAYSHATNAFTTNHLKLSLDYSLNQNFIIGIYADHTRNLPIVSALSYKTSVTDIGVNLRFSLSGK